MVCWMLIGPILMFAETPVLPPSILVIRASGVSGPHSFQSPVTTSLVPEFILLCMNSAEFAVYGTLWPYMSLMNESLAFLAPVFMLLYDCVPRLLAVVP